MHARKLAGSEGVCWFRLDVQVHHFVTPLETEAESAAVEPLERLVSSPLEASRKPAGQQHRLRHRRRRFVNGRFRIRSFGGAWVMRRDGIPNDHPIQVRKVAPEARGVEELRNAFLPDRQAFPGEVADTGPMPQVRKPAHAHQ